MRNDWLCRWLVVALVVAAPVVATGVPGPSQSAGTEAPGAELLADRLGVDDRADVPRVERDVRVVVELKEGATPPAGPLRVERTYTRSGARYYAGTLPLDRVSALSRDQRIESIEIATKDLGSTGKTAPGVADIGADALHERGIRGEGITVGVIDSGFRPSDPEIAGHVAAYNSFDDLGRSWVHGTAVASVVADTAPNATLHLAAVGETTTPEEYRRAVEWLRRSGADIIVDAGSYFGQPGDGSGELSRIAAEASGDTVFVAAAGNYARRHWTGGGAADEEWVTFGDREGNALGNGTVAGRVSVSLRWDEWPAADYDLYLMRVRDGEDAVVARSATRQELGEPPTERIDTSVPRGRYYVAVRAREGTPEDELELYANRRLNVSRASGSLTAPGTAPGVLTVGATANGSVAAFSSRGPVGDRHGLDLLAPDSVAASRVTDGEGTSYAAPYVAGVAALLESRYPELGPTGTRAVLRRSAKDIGAPGPDTRAGYGILDARAAYLLAEKRVGDTIEEH